MILRTISAIYAFVLTDGTNTNITKDINNIDLTANEMNNTKRLSEQVALDV